VHVHHLHFLDGTSHANGRYQGPLEPLQLQLSPTLPRGATDPGRCQGPLKPLQLQLPPNLTRGATDPERCQGPLPPLHLHPTLVTSNTTHRYNGEVPNTHQGIIVHGVLDRDYPFKCYPYDVAPSGQNARGRSSLASIVSNVARILNVDVIAIPSPARVYDIDTIATTCT